MMKICTFFSLLIISFGASAQFDLSCEFVSHAEGASVVDDPMDGRIIITNEGADIPIGDTLTFGYIVSGEPYSLTLDAGSYDSFGLEEVFVSGTSLTFGSDELEWFELDLEVEVCATVYGIGPLAVPDFTGDTDTSNNSTCITYTLPHPSASIHSESSNLNLVNFYVNADQLMLVNDANNGDLQAKLSIAKMNGQIVRNENFVLSNGTTVIPLNSLTTGIYLITVETEVGLITRKIGIH